jgi:hypothetical protein
MARSKSTSGSKPTKEQPSVAGAPDARAVAAVAAETAPTHLKPEVKPGIRPEARIATEPRRTLEVVKTESGRVVPINLEDEIRRRAYELYKQRGTGTGSEAGDWLVAEREVRQRYHQQQSA